MLFEGKQVLLTGGSGVMGGMIARRLIAEGSLVTVLDRAPPATSGVTYLEADLGSQEGVDAAVDAIRRQPWDILINLAGVQSFGLIDEQPTASLYATYLINLVAPARLIQAVIPGMKAQGGGRIVNIGSIFGSINFAHFATYSSSKAGLRGLSQAIRRELTGTGVGVTYIAPRAVNTPLNSPLVLRYAALTGMTMDEPEAITAQIVEAIRRDRNDVYLGFPERLFVRLNALFPSLIDRALRPNDLKARALLQTTQT